MKWIDVHTHLNFLKNVNVEEALAAAQSAGVGNVITIGTEPGDLPVVLELAKKYYPVVACTLGIHPHEGGVYSNEVEEFIVRNLAEEEVVAVGEIGLDYYYEHSARGAQKEAFRRQLEIALRHEMPVEIHTRDAEEDTIEILSEVKSKAGKNVSGIVHCFTGTRWLAEKALDLGLDISISGVVTFKKADELREVVRYVPLDRLHIETDAPYLSPVPHRGQPNVPAYVVHTAKMVAELKGVSEEELKSQTNLNARRVFPKWRLDS